MPQLVVYMEVIARNKDFSNTENNRFKMRHVPYPHTLPLKLKQKPKMINLPQENIEMEGYHTSSTVRFFAGIQTNPEKPKELFLC